MDTIRTLIQNDAVQARMNLYLRLLYNEGDADIARIAAARGQAPPNTLAILRQMDFERLKVERRARINQLMIHLGKQCGALWSALPKDLLRPLVSEFANSEDFWEIRGRNLAENFCLFARTYFNERDQTFFGDLAELLGTVSALMSGSDTPSPWRRHFAPRDNLPGSQKSEAMRLSSDLLDAEGNIRLTPAAESSAAGRHEICVYRFPDGSCILSGIDRIK
jgi:hypothetical protein